MAKKITDLASLELEVQRLKGEARLLEKQLDQNFDHLQDNFFTLAWNSLLNKTGARQWPSGIAQLAFKNEAMQDLVSKLINFLADKASDGVDSILGFFSRRKKTEE
ncbi:MAG: hypothetical protein QM731_21030 [Chitinophagaceae bacterium]